MSQRSKWDMWQQRKKLALKSEQYLSQSDCLNLNSSTWLDVCLTFSLLSVLPPCLFFSALVFMFLSFSLPVTCVLRAPAPDPALPRRIKSSNWWTSQTYKRHFLLEILAHICMHRECDWMLVINYSLGLWLQKQLWFVTQHSGEKLTVISHFLFHSTKCCQSCQEVGWVFL